MLGSSRNGSRAAIRVSGQLTQEHRGCGTRSCGKLSPMCQGFWECQVSGQIAVWLTAFGTIGVVFYALTSEWWQAKFFGPVLELSFEDDPAYITRTWESVSGSNEPVCVAFYVRVKVQNRRKAVAKKCQAYLINVEKFDKNQNTFKPTIYCDSIRLSWSCQPTLDSGYKALDLPNKVNQFVDVVATRSHHPFFEMQLNPSMNRYASLFIENGIFQFTILVTGNRVTPKKIKIIFGWSGVWDKFKAYKG